MTETECFTVEIEGEEIEVCTTAMEYGRLWYIDYSRYWIVKRDNEYQAHVSLDEYLEYDSLSEAWLTVRSFLLGDIKKEKLS